MRKFLNEFKTFISRGNVMDMAVGIIIGGAFTSIVTSLVNDIINPVLGLFGGMNFDKLSVNLLTAVINFLIMALIIFIMIKAINSASEKFSRKEKEKPTTKTCPYCKTKIAIDAVRCPNCTSHLEDGVSKS